MESLLTYRKVIAWALGGAGSRDLEAIPEQQRRLVWLKESGLCVTQFCKGKKKMQVAGN